MAEINLLLIFICSIGFDLLIGDPSFLIHPVQIIGFYIKQTTNFFLHKFGKNTKVLFWGGLFISISTIGISFSFGKLIELNYFQSGRDIFSGLILFLGLSSCMASRGLISSVKEISNLIGKNKINAENEEFLKNKVQRIVSRDVSSSSTEHLLRSSTESLTENSVDGIFGPLFWMFVGMILIKFSIFLPGPLTLGFSYKAISTLDSMIGYKHDQLKFLGFFSAKIEDYFTFIPSRLVLLTLPIIGSKITNYSSIIKKSYLDGKKYASPNAGVSEAVFAYVCNIKLGGISIYNNKIVEKPIINSNGNTINSEKVNLICKLILMLQFFWTVIFVLIFLMN